MTKDHKTAILILKTARKLFIKKGFADTSISKIAKGCNINKSLIYHHFESKEGLWKAIKAEMISSYIDLEKKEADFSKTILNKISEGIKGAEKKVEDNPGITIIGIVVIAIALAVLYKTIKNKNK